MQDPAPIVCETIRRHPAHFPRDAPRSPAGTLLPIPARHARGIASPAPTAGTRPGVPAVPSDRQTTPRTGRSDLSNVLVPQHVTDPGRAPRRPGPGPRRPLLRSGPRRENRGARNVSIGPVPTRLAGQAVRAADRVRFDVADPLGPGLSAADRSRALARDSGPSPAIAPKTRGSSALVRLPLPDEREAPDSSPAVSEARGSRSKSAHFHQPTYRESFAAPGRSPCRCASRTRQTKASASLAAAPGSRPGRPGPLR